MQFYNRTEHSESKTVITTDTNSRNTEIVHTNSIICTYMKFVYSTVLRAKNCLISFYECLNFIMKKSLLVICMLIHKDE